MSLDVPTSLLTRAESGEVTDEEFVDCVRTSLPYAWQTVSRLTTELTGSTDEYAANEIPPPTEADRGQLLRALASDAIRGGLEGHFGVRIAFQNCHRVATFRPSAVDGDTYREFTSVRGQLLNQSPELRNC